ncbi:MAG: DNA methyltransferase [Bacteroidota bacterium]
MKKLLNDQLFDFVSRENGKRNKSRVSSLNIDKQSIPIFTNEYWTSKQRQAHSIHEVSYRACFKPQLPRFFIERLTKPGDVVYDPFSGRGTTIIEAALLQRNIIANDINPLSAILSQSRLIIPSIEEITERLEKISLKTKTSSNIDLSMFYHKETMSEILSLKKYLHSRSQKSEEDSIDRWIRMVATNRLTGHSKGFFSVYTLPPNQALSAESQRKINRLRKQKPEYRNVKDIILKKSKQLINQINDEQKKTLGKAAKKAAFITADARVTKKIKNNSVALTVTSPPFLDVVQYVNDNWLRCWFNGIDAKKVSINITMSRTLDDWCNVMGDVFRELYRITKKNGWVAFEVGEVRSGTIKLEEYVVNLGLLAGFRCEAIMINQQQFTKTANIWGVDNNSKGTNSNRIVLFTK